MEHLVNVLSSGHTAAAIVAIWLGVVVVKISRAVRHRRALKRVQAHKDHAAALELAWFTAADTYQRAYLGTATDAEVLAADLAEQEAREALRAWAE